MKSGATKVSPANVDIKPTLQCTVVSLDEFKLRREARRVTLAATNGRMRESDLAAIVGCVEHLQEGISLITGSDDDLLRFYVGLQFRSRRVESAVRSDCQLARPWSHLTP